jgi:hypothetical protein
LKEEHANKIQELLDQKRDVYAAHDKKWDDYWEQQHLIKRIDKMTRIKRRLVQQKK